MQIVVPKTNNRMPKIVVLQQTMTKFALQNATSLFYCGCNSALAFDTAVMLCYNVQ